MRNSIVIFCAKLFGIVTFIIVAGIFGLFTFLQQRQLIDFSVLEQYEVGRPTILLDDQGKEWSRFCRDRREPIPYKKMPESVLQAFIAAEDRQFFNHIGVSFKGIIRSALINIYYGRKVQGASTITQQLVKLLFLDASKTFGRKIKEQLYAILIEQYYTKEQILQTYLNNVYFGCGIYGIEAASQRFWSKQAIDLTVDEAALLAGIVQCPNKYCPLSCPLSSERRRNQVLGKMAAVGFITSEERDRYIELPLTLNTKKAQAGNIAPHLRETIRVYLEGEFGKEMLYQGGLIVQTTLNQEMQKASQQAFLNGCLQVRDQLQMPVDGALITIDNQSAEIKALVGGFDFAASTFNRALQARRQMGSIIKPLVYASALEKGLGPADTEIDEPITVAYDAIEWKPRNYDKKFRGRMTRAQALSCSNNIVTIKTMLKSGVEAVVSLAKEMEIMGYLPPYPSLALGCVDVTPKEAVGMFSVFARGGVYKRPTFIRWVKDRWGEKISRQDCYEKQVISHRIADQVGAMLMIGVHRIKRQFQNNWVDSEVMSKTGTTNDSRTCWFAGATPSHTTIVYMGCDDNRSMGENVYPIRTAFPVWLSYHRLVHDPIKHFSYHRSLQEQWIDGVTGAFVQPFDPGAIRILL